MKAAGKPLDAFHVGDFMTPDPVVLRHDDPIALAIHKMAVGGFRHIPIVEDGRPTGVVTARDVFHHLAERFAMTIRVAVLAQDLIWQDRLARAVEAAGATPLRAKTAPEFDRALACADFAIVDLTARGLRPARRDRAGASRPAPGSWPSARTTTSTCASARSRAGADRVLAYRKLFEDGPATIAAWLDGRSARHAS